MPAPHPNAAPDPTAAPRRQLSLLDCTCIIVGIIIGAGFYKSTPDIAQNVASPLALLGVWLLGGLFALIGALCYAELASTYPREGGDYVFLTRAFGPYWGFLFAWTEFWIIRPGSIGAMAFVFAQYAHELVPMGDRGISLLLYATGSIVVLTFVNMVGVRSGAWTQNVLTAIKVIGLLAIFGAALWYFSPAERAAAAPVAPTTWSNFHFAMILVMFTYGGWNDISYVAAEVRNPERNVLRALVLGTSLVIAIYVLTTIAFVRGLGFAGVQQSEAVAADLLSGPLGAAGAKTISLLICISSLGAINGLILTGARVYYALGTDFRLFAYLGRWSERRGTPVRSLAAQAAATLGLVIGFGMYEDGFQRMVVFAAPFFWYFLLMVGISLFVLRIREAHVPRVYRVVLFPVTPILFCLSSLFMLQASTSYAIGVAYREGAWAIGVTVFGLLLGLAMERGGKR